MDYQSLYRWGALKLQEANIEEASLDARLLLEEVCGTDRNTLLVHGDRLISDLEESSYKSLIEKRMEHIPLQHLTGYQEFMGLRFKVTKDVLVPRQDTEILVEEAMKHLHDGMHVLDMCTGSGCILLSLLKYSNDCVGIGVDLSEPALSIAEENAKALQLDATFLQSNLFEQVEGTFDIIVSNPPYIRKDVIPSLQREVKEYEPMQALDGGEDGLIFYREITKEANRYLSPGGMLFYEIGHDQAEEVKEILEENGFYEIHICKDFAGLDRVVYGTQGGLRNV